MSTAVKAMGTDRDGGGDLAPREAEVIEVWGEMARVRCPYCFRVHTHKAVVVGELEHRAAPCPLGTPIPTAWRAAGYVFTPLPTGQQVASRRRGAK